MITNLLMSKPKNHKEFIKPTADELNHSEVLVEDAVEFFYSSLSKKISDMKTNRIEINGLGTFTVRPKRLRELIDRLTSKLNKIKNPKAANSLKIKRNLEVDLEKAQQLNEIVQKEISDKIAFKEAKKKEKRND